MPQKKNPDALELMRSKAATVTMASARIKSILRAMPSGYNRDVQETKEPFMSATDTALGCIRIMDLTVRTVEVHPDTLIKAFMPEIFAADAALEKVSAGESFREAYREVARGLSALEDKDPVEVIKGRTSVGTTGNLGLELLRSRIDQLHVDVAREVGRVDNSVSELIGRAVKIF